MDFYIKCSDFQDAGGETAKDGVSYTGDNSTPVSNDSIADLNQSSSDLNRNLGDVYAIEDGLGSSTSKPRISGGSICSDEAIDKN
ncbi:hypothetical protein Hanom_Chr07g00664651 [Helianthus anomalus]